MTPERPPRFDDPALRSAVRRVWGGESAPPELRSRVESLLEQARAEEQQAADGVIRVAPSLWRSRAGLGMAAAAAVVLGVGIAAFQMSRPRGMTVIAQATPAALPADLGERLVRRHDICVRNAPHDHHHFTTAPKDDFKAIARGMSGELKHPVVATAMGHDWDFRGAAVCPVGQTKSAHLVYARGDAFVSVFSLPASAVSNFPDHQDCDAALAGHPVAGFVESGAFYCVVGSTGGKTPIDLQQVRAIRDQLRSDVVATRDTDAPRYASALARP